jgi:hypothetical protein
MQLSLRATALRFHRCLVLEFLDLVGGLTGCQSELRLHRTLSATREAVATAVAVHVVLVCTRKGVRSQGELQRLLLQSGHTAALWAGAPCCFRGRRAAVVHTLEGKSRRVGLTYWDPIEGCLNRKTPGVGIHGEHHPPLASKCSH